VVINRTSFYFQNCPGLDGKLYDYPRISTCYNSGKLDWSHAMPEQYAEEGSRGNGRESREASRN
jgi:hypothetical protein